MPVKSVLESILTSRQRARPWVIAHSILVSTGPQSYSVIKL